MNNVLKYNNLTAKDPYFLQWSKYRKRNRVVIMIFATFVPAMIAIGYPLSSSLGENKAMFIVFGIWAVLLLIFGNYAALWRCPRCAKAYHMDFGRYVNPMARNCVHCGLPKWSPDGKTSTSKNKTASRK
jgi:Zn ribbon nucleic-acid-binding protein